ncbi:MAG: methyltransferase domain-containing protein [Candidatus Pacearchaeota archaeon]|nr:methyltransferase domain-containing protein [Candidatus Pacearchaeota archaeon]
MEKMPQQTKIRYKIIRKLIGDASGKILLDIGAGYKPISNGIKTKKTLKLDGIKKYKPDICCDINEGISLKNSSVDIIIGGEIIEHIYNPIKFIKECNRILKNGGEIILSTPNLCSLKNRFKVAFGQLPEHCARPSEDESFERHIIDFNFSGLIKILKENGFTIIKKTSNGIILHSRLLFPRFLTPSEFGETIIIKAKKINSIK